MSLAVNGNAHVGFTDQQYQVDLFNGEKCENLNDWDNLDDIDQIKEEIRDNEKVKSHLTTQTILSVSSVAASNVYTRGIGEFVVKHGLSYYYYSKLMEKAGYFANSKVFQYIAANVASSTVEKIMEMQLVQGISIGMSVNAASAVMTAGTVYTVGAIAHNSFLAKTENEKVSLNPFVAIKSWWFTKV